MAGPSITVADLAGGFTAGARAAGASTTVADLDGGRAAGGSTTVPEPGTGGEVAGGSTTVPDFGGDKAIGSSKTVPALVGPVAENSPDRKSIVAAPTSLTVNCRPHDGHSAGLSAPASKT